MNWIVVKKTSLAAALAAGMSMMSANAQTPASDQSDDKAAGAPFEEVIVTGSRIPQTGLHSVSPIVDLEAEKFEARGAMRPEEMLTRMPQVIAAPEGASATRRAKGTSQIDLRGLGPERTLVLVNGRRMPYGSPDSLPTDINQVPFALVKSVEVLTGGASAVYGSDAIAGVVNFILRDDFEGVKFTSTLGTYQHHNDSTAARNAIALWAPNNPGQYDLPEDTVWDGFSQLYSVVAGKNFDDGRGNITVFASYRETDEVKMSERDYTACLLAGRAPDGNTFTCAPSPVGVQAGFSNTGAANLPSTFRAFDNQFLPRNAAVDQFNDQQYEQLLRPQEQYDFGGMMHLEINEHFIPFMEASFYSMQTAGDFSPTGVLNNGIVANVGGFNCDNPYFSAQQADFLCTSRGLSTGSNYDPVTGAYLGPESVATGVILRRRAIENGTRYKEIDLTTFRNVIGARGALFDGFQYEVSANYSRVELDQWYNDVSQFRASQALFAVIDRRVNPDGTPLDPNTFGKPACSINVDNNPANDNPACAPLDYFSSAGPSEAAAAYINSKAFGTGDTSMTNVLATISGDLGAYGLTVPTANQGIGVAFGMEYRRNTLTADYDLETQALGLGSPVSGRTEVNEVFGEIMVPLIDDRTMFQHLSFEGAYRYSDYKDSISTDTYKLGLNWEPISDIRFRTSFQRAVRAPNIIELYASQVRGTRLALLRNPNGFFDPCAGPNPWASFEQCARTGVTAEQYGTIADNSFAGQLTGGNPNLEPEVGETFMLGVVLQPSFIPGLTVTLDRFDIEVDDLIGVVNPNFTLTQCLQTGEPFFCSLISRGGGGTLFASNDAYISTLNVNTGSVSTVGWDIMATYPLDLGGLGSLDLSFSGTYLEEYVIQPLPTSTAEETFDCAGYHGFACRQPKPEWRHFATAGWNTPWWDLSLGLTWRYISEVETSRRSSQAPLSGPYFPVDDLGARSYLDLAVAWLPEDSRWSIRGGINNLMDVDPPLTGVPTRDAGGNGSTYSLFYDSMGRYFFLSGTVEFN